jgi:hypothetical protein
MFFDRMVFLVFTLLHLHTILQGPAVQLRVLPIVTGITPAIGPAAGQQSVNISGLAFDPGSGAIQQYYSVFTGTVGRSMRSDACTVISTQLLSCHVPQWRFPAIEAVVTVFADDQQIRRYPDSPTLRYTYLPSCQSYSSLWAYVLESKTISISGYGLEPVSDATCVFRLQDTEMMVAAVSLEAGGAVTYRCSTPNWNLSACASAQNCMRNATLYVNGSSRQICGGKTFSFLSAWDTVKGNAGLAAGGSLVTVSGGGFNTSSADYVCRFTCPDAVYLSVPVRPLSRTSLVCTAPAVTTLPCTADVDLLQGSQPVHGLQGPAKYQYAPVWLSTNRRTVPMTGEASIDVYGVFELIPDLYHCAFQSLGGGVLASQVYTPVYINLGSLVKCDIPAWNIAGDARFDVVANGVKLARVPSEDYIITFTEESWSNFEPLSSLVVGPIRLFFLGNFEDGAGDYSCKIAASDVSRMASVSSGSVTGSSVACELPQWHPDQAGPARVYLLRGGVEIVPRREPLSFRLDAIWTGLSASSGTSSGGTVITVFGNGFSDLPKFYTCRVCKSECMQMQTSVATFMSPSRLKCTLPSWTFAGGTASVELDSQQGIVQYCGVLQVPGLSLQYGCSVGSSSTAAPFGDTFEFLSSWQDFYPQVMPSTAGIPITVSGYGFDPLLPCTCSFTAKSEGNVNVTVNATILSSKLLICEQHEWISSTALVANLNVDCHGVRSLAEGNATLLHTLNSLKFVTPSKSSAGGGTLVTLQGINFCYSGSDCSNEYRCVFASDEHSWNSSVVPTNVTSDTVVCASPSWPFEIPASLSVYLLDLQKDAVVWAKTTSVLALYEAVTDANILPCSVGTCSAGTCSNSSRLCLSASTMHTIAVSGNGFNVSAMDYVCSIQLTDSRGTNSWLEGSAAKPTSTQRLVCDVPMLPLGFEARKRVLYVRKNGQILGSVQAEHYPEWTTLSPRSGSAHGCVSFEFPCKLNAKSIFLRAYGLIRNTKYYCRYVDAQGRETFGASALPVSETQAQCFLPVWSNPAALVTVYLVEQAGRVVEHNAQSSSMDGNRFLFQPIVTEFSPKAFMSNESTAISVLGYGFAAGSIDKYECRVISRDNNAVIMTIGANPMTDQLIRCIVPAIPLMSQRAVFRVVDRGPPESDVTFAEHLKDDYLAIEQFWARLEPSAAPASGGDLITVFGSGFEASSDSYLCKFSHAELGSVESSGVAVSSTAIVCKLPRWSYQEISMLFELFEAKTRIQAHGNTEFLFRATWWLPHPQGSPVDGGGEITIVGYGFDMSRNYSVLLNCSRGTLISDDLVVLDFNTIVFSAPAIVSIQDHEQNVSSIDLQRKHPSESEPISVHQQYSAPLKYVAYVQYVAYVDKIWTSWRGILVDGEPFEYSTGEMRAPTSGGTPIYMSGDGFDDRGSVVYTCRFSGVKGSVDSIDVLPVNRTLIKFLVPPWPYEVVPGEMIELTLLRSANLPFKIELRQDAHVEVVPVVKSLLQMTAPNANNSVIIQGMGFDRFILYYCIFEQQSSVAPYFPVERQVGYGFTLSETEIQCDSVDWGSEFRSRNISVIVEDEFGVILHAAFNVFAMPLQVLMVPWFLRSDPAESYVLAEPLVTIIAHGLDGTLPSIPRDLRHGHHGLLQHLHPDLQLNESTGLLFNLQTRHGVFIDAIDLHTRKLSENTKCSVFYRNGSFEGFENDVGTWQQVPSYVTESDLASLTRVQLVQSLDLPAEFMVALLVLLTDGIGYAEPQYAGSEEEDDVEDYFLGIQGGGVVLADWNPSRGYAIQHVIRKSVTDTFFAGKVVYRNQMILGRKYKCKFEHAFSGHAVDTTFSYAFTADEPDRFVAQSFTCKMPKWPYGEALVRLSIEDDTGQELMNAGGSDGNFRIFSRWETLSRTVDRAFGGSHLRLTGHGFDRSSLSTYACNFQNAFLESETSPVLVHNVTHLECVSPPWNFAASKTLFTVQRNGLPVQSIAANQLFEFTEGISEIYPTSGPAQGGVVTKIRAFGLDANVPYQCAWSIDNETSYDVHNSSVVSLLTPAVNVSVWYAFCISPAWGAERKASNVSVHLLRDGMPLDRRGNNGYSFESTWQQIHPSQGSFANARAITFTGYGFDENIGDWHGKPGSSHPASEYSAIFAQWEDSTSFVKSTCVYTTRTIFVVCDLPQWPYDAMAIRVSLIYRNLTVLYTGDSGNKFLPFTSWQSVNVSQGPATGGMSLLIAAQSLRTDQNYSCLFKSKRTSEEISCAQRINATALTCRTPFWDLAAQETNIVVLDSNGIQIPFEPTSNTTQTFRFLAGLTGASVSRAYASGGDATVFEGFGFDMFSAVGAYKCVWSYLPVNDVMQVNATVLSSQRLVCVQPPWGSSFAARNTTLKILHNGKDIQFESSISSTTNFEWVASWTHLDSRTTLRSSSDSIRIFGFGFDSTRESKYACNFTSMDDSTKQAEGVRVKVLNSSELICYTGEWMFEIANTSVSLYLDGVLISYTGIRVSKVTFVHLVTSVQPTSAPSTGGSVVTVSGFGFSSLLNYTCSFVARITDFQTIAMASVVSFNEITCIVPTWTAPAQGTNFFLSSSSGAVDSAAEFGLSVAIVSTWATHFPSRSSAQGGGNMTITGAGFDNTRTVVQEYRCIFSASRTSISISATVLNMNTILCLIPVWGKQYAEGIVNISLTADGSLVQPVADASFQFWQVWVNVQPKAALAGGAKITILGAGFHHNDSVKYTCTFNSTMDPAISLSMSSPVSVLNSSMLVCENASWQHPYAVAKVGLIYEAAPVLYEGAGIQTVGFYQAWFAATPSSAASTGGIPVTITGYGFRSDENYSCIFKADVSGYIDTSSAEYVSKEILRCLSPFWDSQEQKVSLIIVSERLETENSSSYAVVSKVAYSGLATGGRDTGTFVFESRLFAVKPSTGSAKGGVSLIITGNGLAAHHDYQCLWTTDKDTFDPSSWLYQWKYGNETFDAGWGGCHTYTNDNKGFCVAHGACLPCDAACAVECEGINTVGRAMMNVSNGNVSSFGVSATYFNDSMLACQTPAWGKILPSLTVDFLVIYEVNSNPMEVESAGLQFYFSMEIFEVTPRYNSPVGKGSIMIHGIGFDTQVQYNCIFTSTSESYQSVGSPNPAIVHGLDSIECKLPVWPFGRGPSTVHIQQSYSFHKSNRGFMEFLGAWRSIYPSAGIVVGGVPVTVKGFGFDGSGQVKYRCEFSDGNQTVYSQPFLAAADPQHMICSAPPWPAKSKVVNVTVQSYPNVSFPSEEPWNQGQMTFDYREQVVKFSPLYADSDGGEVITVTGLGFNEQSYRCVFATDKFEAMSALSFAKDQSTVLCEAPYWGTVNFEIQIMLFRNSLAPTVVPKSVSERLQNVSKFIHLSARELSRINDLAVISQWGDAGTCCVNSTGPVYMKDTDYSPGAAAGYVAFESYGEFLQIDEPIPAMLQSWGGLTIIAVSRFRCANVTKGTIFGERYLWDGPGLMVKGAGSYHFDGPDNCYMSFKNAPADWVLADDSRPPAKKPFGAPRYDAATRTFTGTIDWSANNFLFGSNRSAYWEYEMVFSDDFVSIAKGQVTIFDANGTNYTQAYGTEGLRYVRESGCSGQRIFEMSSDVNCESNKSNSGCVEGGNLVHLSRNQNTSQLIFQVKQTNCTTLVTTGVVSVTAAGQGSPVECTEEVVCEATTDYHSPIVIQDNVWMSIVARYNANENVAEIFVNGTLLVKEPCAGSWTNKNLTRSYIGKSSSPDDDYFTGDIRGMLVAKEAVDNETFMAVIEDLIKGGFDADSVISTSNGTDTLFGFVLVNRAPDFSGSTIFGIEGVLFDDVWGSFTRGMWKGVDRVDELEQNVTFFVESVRPSSLFEIQPSIRPCNHAVGCNTSFITFQSKLGMYGNAVIRVYIKDGGGSLFSGIDRSAVKTFFIRISPPVVTPSFKVGGTISVLENAGMIRVSSFINDVILTWNDFAHYSLEAEAEQPYMFAVQPSSTLTCITERKCVGNLNFEIAKNLHGNTTVRIRMTETTYDQHGSNVSQLTNWSSFLIVITSVNQPPEFVVNATVRNFLLNGELTPLKEDDGPCFSLDYFATRISPGPKTDFNGTACLMSNEMHEIYREDALGCNEHNQTMTFQVLPTYDGKHNVTASSPVLLLNGTLFFCIRENSCGNGDVECYSNFSVSLKDDGGIENGGNDTLATSFAIFVQEVNHPPAFDMHHSITVMEVESPTFHIFTSQIENISKGGLDEEYQSIQFNSQFVAGDDNLIDGGLQISSNGSVAFSTRPYKFGYVMFKVWLEDDGGIRFGRSNKSADHNLTIFVQFVNHHPSFVFNSPVYLNETSNGMVRGVATNITAGFYEDIQNLTFQVSYLDGGQDLFLETPFITASGDLMYNLTNYLNGKTVFSVTLVDDGGGSQNHSEASNLTIIVLPINDSPVFSIQSNVSSLEGNVLVLPDFATGVSAGPGTESAEQTVSFFVSCTGLTFSQEPYISPTGTLGFEPAPEVNGLSDCTVRLQDSGGTHRGGLDTSVDHRFSITVTAVNDAPSFSLGTAHVSIVAHVPDLPSNDTSNQRHQTIVTSFSAGPVDEEDTQQVYFSVDWSAHSTLFENVNITVVQKQARIDMFLAPYQFTKEPIVLNITAHDDGGTANGGGDTSPVQALRVSILFVNSPPTFNIVQTMVQVEEDSSYSASSPFVTNITTDSSVAEPQNITFSVIGTSDIFIHGPTIDSSGNLNFKLAPNAHGKTNFSISAQDSGGTDRGGVDTSIVKKFTIEVAPVNDPPTFEIRPSAGRFFMNPENVNISVPDFVFSISKGDERENDQNITFTVNFKSGELLVFSIGISPDGILSLDLAHNTYGIARYEVVAVDSGIGNNTSVAKSFDLEILFKNQAPSFSLNLTILVVDEDSNCDCECGHVGLCCTSGRCSMPQFVRNISRGPDLFLEAVQELSFVITPAAGAEGLIKPGAAVDENGTLMFELEGNQTGSASFSIYLQDSGGTDGDGVNRSEAQRFEILVNPVNDAPLFSVSAPQFFVLEDQGPVTILRAVINISSGPQNEDQTVTFSVVCAGLGFKKKPVISLDGALAFESAVRFYTLMCVYMCTNIHMLFVTHKYDAFACRAY